MYCNLQYVEPKMLAVTKEAAEQECFSDRELHVLPLENALILPGKWSGGGGVLQNDQYYSISYLNTKNVWAHPYKYDPNEVISDSREAVYVGILHDVWGHNITDNLKHFWYLFDDRVPDHIKKLPMVYTLMKGGQTISPNYFRLLELMGVDTTRMECISAPTSFSCLYLPDECFGTSGEIQSYTKEYVDLIDRICSKVTPDTRIEKLYFTRTQFSKARETGEADIQRAFEHMGFVSVSPEQYTADEQIAMLLGCKVFATTEGSCSHNAIFLREGSELVYVRKVPRNSTYQNAVNHLRNLNVTIIDGNLSNFVRNPKKPGVGPFFLYVNKRMAAYAGVKPHFPLVPYLRYACSGIRFRIHAFAGRVLRKIKRILLHKT